MMPSLREAARALGGQVTGGRILAPGPHHSQRDRSLSVWFDPQAPEGFGVTSFAGDDFHACRDHVRERLGLPAWEPPRHNQLASFTTSPQNPRVRHADEGGDRRFLTAIRPWLEARGNDPRPLWRYLATRGLPPAPDLWERVIRFHPTLYYGRNETMPGMVALMREIATDMPVAIQRTFFNPDGSKLSRKMLGRAGGAAIKLDANETVEQGLVIGEGLETCQAARLGGLRPCWALGSAGAIAAFPVLPGVDALTILAETDDSGANARAVQQCGERWLRAGREVIVVEPKAAGDMNDVWREACA